ncbi:hypothetical protein GUJ93_ZPchr0010g8860 [Zizania palustris]|uniref:Uncharacterized protein n=1 Tax=Zizania palustris TaxID=103762 RepID=A0A8J6BLK2_ZIZPA|nr:hypothetical protein GUJ93_ZPchr0010g8860 [Zizania palustris]
MELEILGMNFGCVVAALADAKIPGKGCLLPLATKLLGYCIVAASTTVKLLQRPEAPGRRRAQGRRHDDIGEAPSGAAWQGWAAARGKGREHSKG